MSKFIVEIDFNNQCTEILSYHTGSKFLSDKIRYEDESFQLILDGIIVNKQDILLKNNNSSWEDAVRKMYQVDGISFHEKLKGSYYGFFYDKKKHVWSFFSDQLGTKPLFYYLSKDKIIVSNNFYEVVSYFNKNGIQKTVSVESCYDLLTKGFLSESYTILKNIKRLKIGFRLAGSKNRVSEQQFYKLQFIEDSSIKMNDAIHLTDELFKKSICKNFNKDIENSYTHFAALSGGLDSRMTVMIAHKMGYTNQLNYTFSQSGYLDQTIACDIASYLKHEWLFKALDNGNFLYLIDETTKLAQGSALYYGLAHGYSMLDNLNFEKYGLAHTGQLGDVVIGSFLNKFTSEVNCHQGAYSSLLKDKPMNTFDASLYSNQEDFLFYTRALSGANVGLNVFNKYTETLSPFLDLDFLETMFKIPISIRGRHKLYKKWILTLHKDIGTFPWEKIGCSINSFLAKEIKIKSRSIVLNNLSKSILTRIGLLQKSFNSKNHMNPLHYYYRSNSELKQWMDKYFYDHIDLLDFSIELKNDCIDIYKCSYGTERNQVLSLLSILKEIEKC